MKRQILIRAVLFLLTLTLALASMSACNGFEVADDELLLISRGEVKFDIVVSSELTEDEVAMVEEFVKTFEALDIQMPEIIYDVEPDDATDGGDADESADGDDARCEILFGTGFKGREGCEVTKSQLGEDGYVVKVVGDKIIVAGGTREKFSEAIALLLSDGLKITDATEPDKYMYLVIKRDFLAEQYTEHDNPVHDNPVQDNPVQDNPVYDIPVPTVGNLDLAEFVLSYADNDIVRSVADLVRQTIRERTGIALIDEDDLPDGASAKHCFTICVSSSSSDAHFSVGVMGDDLVMTCNAPTRLLLGAQRWIEEMLIPDADGKVDFGKSFEWNAAYRYSEFGAVGDGVTDDFDALMKTHVAANGEGVNVIADDSAVYYIGRSSHGKVIPIETNVNFGRAKFIIDDTIVNPFDDNVITKNIFDVVPSANRSSYLVSNTRFTDAGYVASTVGSGAEAFTVYKKSDSSPALKKGAAEFPMTFGEDVMLVLVNAEERVYIRSGGNANNGAEKREVILVSSSGRIDPSTPVLWDYSGFSEIRVIPIAETTVTVTGGIFTTWANQIKTGAPAGKAEGDQYYYFSRGIRVSRSNTVVRGLTHLIEKEAVPTGSTNDGGYPYNGWLDISLCNGVLVENVTFTGHRVYKEDRVDASGNPVKDSGTHMGTYDINANSANNITWRGCKQSNSITNNTYWGLMGSNFVKNLTFDSCELSRFDAHQGVCNATVINSTIGQYINCIGGGTLSIINTKKLVGGSFVNLRNDYGGTWEGDVIIKNCTLLGYKAGPNDDYTKNGFESKIAIFMIGFQAGHDYGYQCYLFKNIEIDGFKFDLNVADRLMFRGGYNATSFTDPDYAYVPPEKITIKNMDATQTFKMSLYSKVFPSLVATSPEKGKIYIDDPMGLMTVN